MTVGLCVASELQYCNGASMSVSVIARVRKYNDDVWASERGGGFIEARRDGE